MLNLDVPATVVPTRIEPYQVDFALQISENLLLEFVATSVDVYPNPGWSWDRPTGDTLELDPLWTGYYYKYN